MSTVVSRVRRSVRRSKSRVSRARRPAPPRAPAVVSAEPTFTEIAAHYLERHIERYLVPRAAQLARYAHAYLATVHVPGPRGASLRFTEKPFRQITTADVEEAIERKAMPATQVMRRGRVRWTRRVGGGPTANRLARASAQSCGGGRSSRATAIPPRLPGPACRRCAHAPSSPARADSRVTKRHDSSPRAVPTCEMSSSPHWKPAAGSRNC